MGDWLWEKTKLLGWKGGVALLLSVLVSVPAASFLGYTAIIPIEFAAFFGLKDTISEIWSASPAIVLSYFVSHWVTTRTLLFLKTSRPIAYRKAKANGSWKPTYSRIRYFLRVGRRIESAFKAILFAIFFSFIYFGDVFGAYFFIWCLLTIVSNYAVEINLRFRVKTLADNFDNISQSRLLWAGVAPITLIAISISFGAGFAKFLSDSSGAAVIRTTTKEYCGVVVLVTDSGLVLGEHLGHASLFGFNPNLGFSFVPYASLIEVREQGDEPLCDSSNWQER